MSTPTKHSDQPLSFEDTHTAFAHLSDKDLSFSYAIFKMMNSPFFVKLSSIMALWAVKLRLPVGWLIKATVFRQFCGGESVQESLPVSKQLGQAGIGTILDYSVEGNEDETAFRSTFEELIGVVRLAKAEPDIPISVMKVTGIARFGLLEKITSGGALSTAEQEEMKIAKGRLLEICQAAADSDVPIYIDAEETWIQGAIDAWTEEMMRQFNGKRAIVFNTLQMYRHDRLAYFQQQIGIAKNEGYRLGVKVVRGAYLEKENRRAEEMGYPTPMQPSKAATDKDYNAAMEVAIANIENVEVSAATHNEDSTLLLTQLMQQHNLPNNHPHVYFAQLYGMSDYMSYNLANSGYNIAKYLPYGPVRATVPYLIRRAQENSAISGQMGKELRLIIAEKKRRKG